MDKTFAAFFRRLNTGTEKPGFPRFKGEARFNSFEFTYGDGCKLRPQENGRMRLYVQGVGELRMCYHRPVPEAASIKRVVLKRTGSRWHAFLSVEIQEDKAGSRDGEIGIDVGLRNLVALSNGTLILGPRHLEKSLAELRTKQRGVERKIKGSNNRADAQAAVARLHGHIANQRRDHLHKLTRQLVDAYGFIALEDLPMAFMNQDRNRSRSSRDAALGILASFLEYKAVEAGTHLELVNPAYTSQDCSECGTRVPKPLSQRTHRCPVCGLVLDRDVNAARSILQKALKQYEDAGTRRPEHNVGRVGPSVLREALA